MRTPDAADRAGRKRWHPPWPDIVLAVVLLLGSGGVIAATSADGAGGVDTEPRLALVPFAILTFLQVAPLAFRRRRPVLVLAIVVVASVILSFFERTPLEAAALFVALYSVAAHVERTVAIRAGIAALVVVAGPLMVNGDGVGPIEGIFELGFLALGWMLGAYLGELRGRAERVRREQENEKRRAIAEEQARIARELHDVMAHSVSVIVVQAAAADDVFDSAPERAREALRSIEVTGRRALADVRRVLDVVRVEDGSAGELGPQPGLARLEELLAQVRATGLPVVLRVEGVAAELPEGIDLSAYRIVQEALTNTLKHGADVSEASVLLRYAPQEFVVEVCDNGRIASGERPTDGRTGRGLIGMRERVALYRGDLVAGPQAPQGFGVRARFPLEGDPA